MNTHKNANTVDIYQYKAEFESVIQQIFDNIGENAFRNLSRGRYSHKFHPAIFDAIMIATYKANQRGIEIQDISDEKHKQLLSNIEFKTAISKRTTDLANISKRIHLVGEILYGVDL